MLNGTNYPDCGHGPSALVDHVGCAACLSNQRDEARSEVERQRAEIVSLRESLDGAPCNEDFRREVIEMSSTVDRMLRERDEAHDQIERQRAEIGRLKEVLEWYAERARSLSGRLASFKNGTDANYVMAVLSELSLDAGKRSASASAPNEEGRKRKGEEVM